MCWRSHAPDPYAHRRTSSVGSIQVYCTSRNNINVLYTLFIPFILGTHTLKKEHINHSFPSILMFNDIIHHVLQRCPFRQRHFIPYCSKQPVNKVFSSQYVCILSMFSIFTAVQLRPPQIEMIRPSERRSGCLQVIWRMVESFPQNEKKHILLQMEYTTHNQVNTPMTIRTIRESSPKNLNSILIYSPSWLSKLKLIIMACISVFLTHNAVVWLQKADCSAWVN